VSDCSVLKGCRFEMNKTKVGARKVAPTVSAKTLQEISALREDLFLLPSGNVKELDRFLIVVEEVVK